MDKIAVAIGGGEIPGWNFKTKDANGTIYDLEEIDKSIRNLSTKNNPKLLFIGTASKENPYYFNAIKNIYESLGCIVDELKIIDNYNKEDVFNKILDADIIYIGGGNTKFMLSEWEKVDLKDVILEAYNKGIIIAGYSAGAYAIFSVNYEEIEGFGIVDGVVCAHYNEKSDEKKNQFFDTIKCRSKTGFAIDNSAAVLSINGKLQLVKGSENAKVIKIEYIDGILKSEEL